MNWGVHTLAWLWPNLAHADCGVQTKFWHRFIFAACVLLSFFSTHHENQHAISLRVFSSNQDARQLALIRCSFCDEWKRAFKAHFHSRKISTDRKFSENIIVKFSTSKFFFRRKICVGQSHFTKSFLILEMGLN